MGVCRAIGCLGKHAKWFRRHRHFNRQTCSTRLRMTRVIPGLVPVFAMKVDEANEFSVDHLRQPTVKRKTTHDMLLCSSVQRVHWNTSLLHCIRRASLRKRHHQLCAALTATSSTRTSQSRNFVLWQVCLSGSSTNTSSVIGVCMNATLKFAVAAKREWIDQLILVFLHVLWAVPSRKCRTTSRLHPSFGNTTVMTTPFSPNFPMNAISLSTPARSCTGLKRRGPEMPGLHTTAREPKRAHFRVPPKFHEKTPKVGKKE